MITEIEKLKQKGNPFELNGVSYCYSTYKKEWVECSVKDLPKLACDIIQGFPIVKSGPNTWLDITHHFKKQRKR